MRMMIAGGGTGGHVFPGIALAEEVCTRHFKNEVIFVGTKAGLESTVVPAAGYRLETISSKGIKGKGRFGLLKGLAILPLSFFQSWLILLKYRPDVVVGVGGYSSGPLVLAAWMQRVPTAIQEQNALPGFTNRTLGRVVRAVFIAFTEARGFFPPDKTYLIGNPIRRALMENYLRSTVAHDRFSLLIFGGSLGAKGLNTRMMEALPYLEDVKDKLHFVHQTGKSDLDRVKAEYSSRHFSAEVVDFIGDMSDAYAKAELVICRAGATTLAELTVCKKASILVPFPFAADNHQEVNARAMVDNGAAIMLRESELDGAKLAAEIRSLLNDPARRQKMEKQAALLGRPEASKELADVCVEMMVTTWGPQGRKRSNSGKLQKP